MIEHNPAKANVTESVGNLRAIRPKNPYIALGMMVDHLMNKPAYSAVGFTSWSKILAGQINRNHYAFIINSQQKLLGMIGWVFADQSVAEAWVSGKPLGKHGGKDGDCIIFNMWSADNNEVHGLILDIARQAVAGCKMLYYRRLYADGRMRIVRLPVNQFVHRHLERKAKMPPRSTA